MKKYLVILYGVLSAGNRNVSKIKNCTFRCPFKRFIRGNWDMSFYVFPVAPSGGDAGGGDWELPDCVNKRYYTQCARETMIGYGCTSAS